MHPKTQYGEPLQRENGFELPLEIPKAFFYKYERFSWLDETQVSFECEFRVSIQSKERLIEWKTEFERLMRIDLKSRKGAIQDGRSFIYQDTFMCQHGGGSSTSEVAKTNKNGDPRRWKRTQCPALIWMGLRRVTAYTMRTYPCLQDYPTWVKMKWNHNHIVHCSRSLSHRRVSNRTLSNLLEMFLEGLSWQEAYQS